MTKYEPQYFRKKEKIITRREGTPGGSFGTLAYIQQGMYKNSSPGQASLHWFLATQKKEKVSPQV